MPTEISREQVGKRMTAQRRLLLKIIQDAGGHLDADELFRRAKDLDPRISLSTIYRNLNLLKKAGVVAERHFAEEHHHYEINLIPGHHHLVCVECGNVFEFENPLIDSIRQTVEKASQFQITDIEVNMRGYCRDCSGNIKSSH